MSKVEVVAYDPRWPAQFEEEAQQLRRVFGHDLLSLHHIGSTAVPGLPAKPILDIMPVVRDIRQVDAIEAGMLQLRYKPRGEYGIVGRRYFFKEREGQRTHHVHAFEQDHPAGGEHLLFRDYLRAHPEQAERYAALKIELAKQFPKDSRGYSEGKSAFISKLLQQAAVWRIDSITD